ncbi:MAG: hypothetical protein RSB82_03930 [Victivallaceae bacterium]
MIGSSDSFACQIEESHWITDYREALQKSRLENKYILMFFDGSDWSPWSMKLRKDIFSNESLFSKLKEEFLCLQLNFPRHSKYSFELSKKNLELKKSFSVDELPCIIILDSDENEIYRCRGAMAYDLPEELVNIFLRIIDNNRLLKNIGSGLGSLSVDELKRLYLLSEDIGSKEIMRLVLQEGVNLKDEFFLSEKFRLLIDEGKMGSKESNEIKQWLTDSQRDNPDKNCFTIAVLEFQELVRRYRKNTLKNPEDILFPLKNYLIDFGGHRNEKTWRIEMMIAQFYLDVDIHDAALKHAELAFNYAPEAMKERVSSSLNYIREHS